MTTVRIGEAEDRHVVVTVQDYRYPAGESAYDDWLDVAIDIHFGAFRAHRVATFLPEEFEALQAGLSRLHRELRGDVDFEAMEQALALRFACDTLGRIDVTAAVRDDPGDARLQVRFPLDQSHLPAVLAALADVLRRFPHRA